MKTQIGCCLACEKPIYENDDHGMFSGDMICQNCIKKMEKEQLDRFNN